MKCFILLHCHKLSCSCGICLHSIPLSSAIDIQLFLNINCDVSAFVKCATRSGLVSYVDKVAAPGDWDNVIRNVIFRGRKGKSFYKSCHFGCPYIVQTYSQIYPCQTLGSPLEHTVIFSFDFDFALYKLG